MNATKSFTALDEWNDFASKCYPNGMTEEQSKQLRRAFFAGAMTAFTHVTETVYADDERAAVKTLEKFKDEVTQECALMAKTCADRN